MIKPTSSKLWYHRTGNPVMSRPRPGFTRSRSRGTENPWYLLMLAAEILTGSF
ncbi:hypothetical protein HanOQP8_Chr10g0349151 [Helianthus annuus]|nr:hypothetical protein HanHA89_Chr10g0366461 [Helianthus annuus]KAJ0695383.1 hypothetical protein HanLR1_Chr10g0344961 [Helianthus annuus]KAJ0698842.1 hypothetical protein HanOQP8_Chr10g0349151 [Helianthus annuus]